MASCTAQDTSNAHTPGSDTRGRAFDWPTWQEAFAHAEGLTRREYQVLALMAWHANPNTGRVERLSIKQIAAETGLASCTLEGRNGIRATLEKKGWLVKTWDGDSRRHATYQLTIGAHRREASAGNV